MKTKHLIVLFLSSLYAVILQAQTNVGGTLTSNTSWTLEGSPYNLIAVVGLPNGVTLTIEPGVHVSGDFDLLIKGILIADGTEEAPIQFNDTRLMFQSTNLSYSSMSWLNFNNCGVQLADETEFIQNDPKNSGTLVVTNSIFAENGYARTKGYETIAALIIENSFFSDSEILGYYPRSETITLINCEILNSTIKSDSYNYGIFMNNSFIKNSELIIGCCGANINCITSKVLNSNFSAISDDNNITISNSILVNSPIDLPMSEITVLNSIIQNDFDEFSIRMGKGSIQKTVFVGDNLNNSLYVTGYNGYYYGDVVIGLTTFCNSVDAIIVQNFENISIIGNNFFQTQNYALKNLSSKSISATYNWWGTTNTEEIDDLIYDMYDNINSGIVDYSNFLLTPEVAAPVSTPIALFKSNSSEGVNISWQPNIENDIAGYIIYYNPIDEFSYANAIDVGNQTEYSIPDANFSNKFVVTAYDTEANGTNDWFLGHESWYSLPAQKYFNFAVTSGNIYCESESIEIGVEVFATFQPENSFIIQLSDISGSFNNPIDLLSINTTNSFILEVPVPDTLTAGAPYLVRLKSTQPEVYSENLPVTWFQTPTSTFSLDALQLCGSESILITYTGNASANAFYQWNFDGGNILSGSGQGEYVVNWDTPGNKTISLIVIENSCNSNVYTITLPVYQPISDFVLDDFVCENQSTIIQFTGQASDSATFYWDFNNANVVSGSGPGPYTVKWDDLGEKTVTLYIDDNGCLTAVTSKAINHQPIAAMAISAPEVICFSETATISYDGSASSMATYLWSFDNGTVLNGSGGGPYEIIWASSGLKNITLDVFDNGCPSDTAFYIQVSPKTMSFPICMVTVDALNQNTIIWEQTGNPTFDSVVIYKEGSQTNSYERIGVKNADEICFFVDTLSDARQNASRYRISVIDTCGYETDMSNYHKTLHLTINSGIGGAWNLIWDQYEGFSYSSINIYRGTAGGDLQKIAEQAGNTFTYTDLTPPNGTIFYQVEIVKPDPCFIGFEKSAQNTLTTTRSNIVNSQEVIELLDNVKFYPNPVNKLFSIESYIFGDNVTLSLFTVGGKEMIHMPILDVITSVDFSNYERGVYIVKINDGTKTIQRKVVKL